MTLKVKVNDPHHQENLKMHIWWFLLKSITSYCLDKPNLQEFWVKMAKITLKVKVNDPYCQYQPRVSQDVACLVQWVIQFNGLSGDSGQRDP